MEPKTTLTEEEIAKVRTAGEEAMKQEIARILGTEPAKAGDVFDKASGGGPGWKPPTI